MAMKNRNCDRCHTCGQPLRIVLDGEEWCDTCQVYRRYQSHGWPTGEGSDECPPYQELQISPTRIHYFECGNAKGYCSNHYNQCRWPVTLETLREEQGVEICQNCGVEAVPVPPYDEWAWCPECKALVEPEGRLNATGIHGDCPFCGYEIEP